MRTIHVITDKEEVWDEETVCDIWGLDNYQSILMYLEYKNLSLVNRKYITVELFNHNGALIEDWLWPS